MHRKRFRRDNTRVEIKYEGRDKGLEAYMYLFDNLIAKTEGGDILINHCGWISLTTQERLSAFPVKLRRSSRRFGYFIVNEKFRWDEGWLNISLVN